MNPLRELLSNVRSHKVSGGKGLALLLALILVAAVIPLAGLHPLEGSFLDTSGSSSSRDGATPASHDTPGNDEGEDVNQSATQEGEQSTDQDGDGGDGDVDQSATQENIQVVEQDANGSADQDAHQGSNQTIRQEANGSADQDASQESRQRIDQDAQGDADQDASQGNDQTIEQEAEGGEDGSPDQDASQGNDQSTNQTAYGDADQDSEQSNDQCVDQDAEGDADQDAGQGSAQDTNQTAYGDGDVDQNADQDSSQTAEQDANTADEQEEDPCAPDEGEEAPPEEGDAELALHKAVRALDGGTYGDEATVEPGEQVAFRLNVTNNGNATAANVTVVDAVPDNTTFVSCSDACARSGDTIAWQVGNLATGTWERVTFVVQVDPGVDDGTVIPNTGFADSEDEDPVESNEVHVIVETAPALDAEKAVRNLNRTDDYGAETTAEPGQHVRFRVNVTNTGTAPVENLTVHDAVLQHTSFVSCSPEAACNHTAGDITWHLGTLEAGATASAFLTLKVSDRAPNGTTLNNTATADSNGTEPVETNVVQVHIEEVAFPPEGEPDEGNATLVKRARDTSDEDGWTTDLQISAGDEVQYGLELTNTGNITLTNISIHEEVPEKSELLGCQPACQVDDGNLTWEFGSLDPGEDVFVVFVVEFDEFFEQEETVIRNVADATSDQGAWESNEVVVTVICFPDSELEKQVRNLERDEAYTTNTTAEPSDRVRYQLTYTNEGNATAEDVVLNDTVPENTTLVSCPECTSVDGRNLTWVLGDQWPTRCDCAHPVVVNFTVELDQEFTEDTIIPNRATVESDEEPPELSNWANVTVLVPEGEPVQEPQGVVDKDVRELNATQSTYGDNVTVAPGDQIRFRLNYTNAGNATARNVTVNDTVLDHTSFVSCTDACNHTAGEIRWDLGNVTPGATVNVTFTLQVSSRTPNGTTLNNVAFANASNHPVVESDEVTVTVEEEDFGGEGEPDVTSSLDKAVANLDEGTGFQDQVNATPGDRIRFQLNYTNLGSDNATNVTLRDDVPERSSFVSASGNVTRSGANLTWNLGTVEGFGTTVVVNFTVDLDDTFPNGTTNVTNIANVTTAEEDELTESDEVIVTVEVQEEGMAASDLAKEVRNVDAGGAFVEETTARPGDLLEFQLTYENQGTAPATNVTVHDAVPNGTDLVLCEAPCTVDGRNLTWTLGTVDAGATESVTFRAELHEDLENGTLVTNVANVTTDTTNATSNEVTVTVRAGPVLDVEKAVDRLNDQAGFRQHLTAQPGDGLQYHLTVRNTGTAPVENVTLTDPVIPRSNLSGSSHPFDVVNGTLEWDLGTLNGNEEVQVTFTVELDSVFPNGTTVLENVATVVANATEPVESENVTVTVEAIPDSDLAKAVKPADADPTAYTTSLQAEPGDLLTYRLRYENTGGANATNVTLRDEVPEHTSLVDCSTNCTVDNGTMTWDLGLVAPSTTRDVTFTVELNTTLPDGSAILENVAVVDTAEEPPTESNEVTVTVEATPDSTLVKAVRNETGMFDTFINATPGEELTYRLTYTNEGNATATDVMIMEEVPEHTSLVDCPECTSVDLENGTLTWDLGSVDPGASTQVNFTTNLDTSFDQRTTLVQNVAVVDTAEEPLVESNEVVVNVTAATDLNLDKTVANLDTGTGFQNVVNATPGDEVRYRLTVTNQGSTPSGDVTLVDTVPENTTLVDATGDPTVTNGTLTWDLGSIDAGANVTVTFTVELDPEFPSGTTIITNEAQLVPEGVEDDADVIVHAVPDLGLQKDSNVTEAGDGDLVEYTLTYWNAGNGTAQNVVLTDVLPENVTFVPEANDDGSYDPADHEVVFQLGDIAAGTTASDPAGSVNVTVRVNTNEACALVNAATLESDLGEANDTNVVTVEPDFDEAAAMGTAYGLRTTENLLWGEPTSETTAVQEGLGATDDDAEATGLTIEGLADVGVLRTESRSAVVEDPDRAVATSTSTATDVNLLGGFITADEVEAKVTATASDDTALVRTAGSSFTNLTVNGVHMEDVAPNTRVELPASVFGDGSYVVLMETHEASNASDADSQGKEVSVVNVTMVHVHITDGSGTPFAVTGPVDLRLGHAEAAAIFPDAPNCAPEHDEALGGHALNTALGTEIVSTGDDPWNRTHGLVELPEDGGVEEQALHHVNVLNGDITAGTWRTRAVGTTADPGGSRVVTTHTVQDACILPNADGCLVAADTVRVTATAQADANTTWNASEVNLVGLTVAGVNVDVPVEPNTEIVVPEVGVVTLNEVHHGTDGSNSVLVRAVHVELFDETSAGYTDLVLGEAAASAQWGG